MHSLPLRALLALLVAVPLAFLAWLGLRAGTHPGGAPTGLVAAAPAGPESAPSPSLPADARRAAADERAPLGEADVPGPADGVLVRVETELGAPLAKTRVRWVDEGALTPEELRPLGLDVARPTALLDRFGVSTRTDAGGRVRVPRPRGTLLLEAGRGGLRACRRAPPDEAEPIVLAARAEPSAWVRVRAADGGEGLAGVPVLVVAPGARAAPLWSGHTDADGLVWVRDLGATRRRLEELHAVVEGLFREEVTASLDPSSTPERASLLRLPPHGALEVRGGATPEVLVLRVAPEAERAGAAGGPAGLAVSADTAPALVRRTEHGVARFERIGLGLELEVSRLGRPATRARGPSAPGELVRVAP